MIRERHAATLCCDGHMLTICRLARVLLKDVHVVHVGGWPGGMGGGDWDDAQAHQWCATRLYLYTRSLPEAIPRPSACQYTSSSHSAHMQVDGSSHPSGYTAGPRPGEGCFHDQNPAPSLQILNQCAWFGDKGSNIFSQIEQGSTKDGQVPQAGWYHIPADGRVSCGYHHSPARLGMHTCQQ